MTLDELFNRAAARVPPFGGVFLDEAAATLNVWVTDGRVESARQAQRVLAEVLDQPRLLDLRPSALKGDYSFAQLKQWHDQVTTEVLGMEGVVFNDLDDRNNRLRIGIEDLASQRAPVEAKLSDLGVPLQAVIFEQRQAAVQASSLQDAHRPILGGLQIAFSNRACTLGFIAVRSGVNGFVTNSHCTNIPGGVENTQYGQPNNLLLMNVGTEAVDPIYWTGGICPAGLVCRYSDAAWARIASGVGFDRGRIANPSTITSPSDWNGFSKYSISADMNPVAGDVLVKVGARSGETTGIVTETCANYGVANSNRAYLCQGHASFSSAAGDSGAPVIRVWSADVWLEGMIWGVTADGSVFSSTAGIQRSDELGNLTVCTSGFSC